MSENRATGRPAPIHDRQLMLVLAYLWVLALVPLLTHTDADVQWHAKHGIVLTIVELSALVAWSTLFGLAWLMTAGFFGCITTLQVIVTPAIGMLIVAFHVFLIVKALQGKRVMVPRVTELVERF